MALWKTLLEARNEIIGGLIVALVLYLVGNVLARLRREPAQIAISSLEFRIRSATLSLSTELGVQGTQPLPAVADLYFRFALVNYAQGVAFLERVAIRQLDEGARILALRPDSLYVDYKREREDCQWVQIQYPLIIPSGHIYNDCTGHVQLSLLQRDAKLLAAEVASLNRYRFVLDYEYTAAGSTQTTGHTEITGSYSSLRVDPFMPP